jgi:formylglycine-generating enzyme required for sulfatase activity
MGKRLCGRIGGGANPQAAYQDPAQSQWFNACSANGEHAYQYADAFDAMQCNAGGWSAVAVTPGSLSTCQSPELGYDGVFDLSGNVWEWEDSCASAANFASCLIRGGDWDSVADSACSGVSPVTRDSVTDSIGFRCCAG